MVCAGLREAHPYNKVEWPLHSTICLTECMDWRPTLNDREGPLYRRIVDALTADVASGRLRRGQQLPTHRALAKALGVDLTTVTRAYTEARRCGLTEARTGQGTFVAESMSHSRRGASVPNSTSR